MLPSIVGLIVTPLAGILAGFIYQFAGAMKNTGVRGLGEFVAAVVLFAVVGSFLAAPTTLIGLPLLAHKIEDTARNRTPKLIGAGFAFGWLTIMGWWGVFGLYDRLHNKDEVFAFALVCLVGAICGGISGWIIARFSRNSPVTTSPHNDKLSKP